MGDEQHLVSALSQQVNHNVLANAEVDVDAVNAHCFELLGALATLMPYVEVESLETGVQAEKLIELLQTQSQLASLVTSLTGTVDASMIWSVDGSRSCAAWMERASGRDRKECNRFVRAARVLRDTPGVAMAFAQGDLSERHVQLLNQTAKKAPEVFVEAEGWLVEQANNLTVRQFSQLLDHWYIFANPNQAEADAAARYDQRLVHLSPGLDGVGWLDVQFEPFGHEIFNNALKQIETEFWYADWAKAREEHGDMASTSNLCRTDAQRRYDAIVEMAIRAMAKTEKPRKRLPAFVTVHVDHKTLTGRICELGSGVQITPGQVTRLLGDADVRVERAVFGTDGKVIDYGRHRRLFVGAARRAIEIRDRCCVFPGCTVPAEHCQVDHIMPWSEGGLTNHNNGQLLCPQHHRNKAKHQLIPTRSPVALTPSSAASELSTSDPPDDG